MNKFILLALGGLAAFPAMAQDAATDKPEYITVTSKSGNRLVSGAVEYGTKGVTFDGTNVVVKVQGLNAVTLSKGDIGKITVTDYPQADLFEAVWSADGSAKDLGKFNLPISKEGVDGGITVNSENPYGIVCPTFDNGYGSKETGKTWGTLNAYYKASYADVNDEFYAAMNDGYAIELIFKLNSTATDEANDADATTVDLEAKPFSNTQTGGFGFVIRKGGKKRSLNYMSGYLKDDSANDYHYANTGVRPLNGEYYHLVAVHDKKGGELTIYLNGELYDKVQGTGQDINPVGDTFRWMGIGADPAGMVTVSGKKVGATEAAFPGQVVVARMYDAALTPADVKAVFEHMASLKKK